jgi:hypothetical protein
VINRSDSPAKVGFFKNDAGYGPLFEAEKTFEL